MKNFVVILSIIAISCNKLPKVCINEGEVNGWEKQVGISSCNSNIGNWVDAPCRFGFSNNLWYISVQKWNEDCDLYLFTIQNIPKKLEKFNLVSGNNTLNELTLFTIYNGGDAIVDRWYLQEDETDNWIKLETINSDSTQVTGQYNVSFVAPSSGKYDQRMPDTINFTNGTFIAKRIK